jgi:hypothetical protein
MLSELSPIEWKCSPILFLIFNRPDLSQRVFARIKEAKPQKLYIAADGPRNDHPDDERLCAEARKVTEKLDWECELHTLYREENLGCGHAVKTAIDWFFENEESGIILEDDCLPDLSFFPYCAELLERYKNDERIGVISGDLFINKSRIKESYYFTNFPHMWGWATWKRVWNNYDFNIRDWPKVRHTNMLKRKIGSRYYVEKWESIFNRTYDGKIDTWDYQFAFMLFTQNQLCIAPRVNLVSNIGFDSRATHTKNPGDKASDHKAESIMFPLSHPQEIKIDIHKERKDLIFRFGQAPTLSERLIKYFKGIKGFFYLNFL